MIKPIQRLSILLFFINISLLAFQAKAADIQVRIDRTQIEVNETFTLTFESSGTVDDDPDFSPLEKDFQVLGKSTSSNISIINGEYTKNQRWNVTLMALQEGTLNIPSIAFGKDKSPEYRITVKPVQASSQQSGAELISELELNTETAYPQSQIIVTQRLLSAKNIAGYEFSPLKTSGVEISSEPLGEVNQYQTQRGGKPYLVLEQRHLIYPQQSGQLNFEPSIAAARLSLNNRNNYDPFRSNTKTVRRASERKSIEVKPIPDNFKGKHWLVAKEVQLVEEFPENKTFKVGEPITRTISILADGQSASQLPEFSFDEITGLKLYPDQPVLNNTPTSDGMTGIQQVKVALIPSTEGRFTLPAIQVPWWNLTTGKMEIAKIDAREFTVGAAAAQSTVSKPVTPQSATPAITPETTITETEPAPVNTVIETSSDSLVWKLLSLLLLLAWLVTLFLLWQQKRKNTPADTSEKANTPSLKASYKQLENACQKNDAQACKVGLLYWANALFDNEPVYSLGELAQRVDTPLSEMIKELNSLLYKNQTEEWACGELLSACKVFGDKIMATQNNSETGEGLESLYK